MVTVRLVLGVAVTFSLLRYYMDYNRAVNSFYVFQNACKRADIMPPYRPHIFKTKVNKKVVDVKHRFNRAF